MHIVEKEVISVCSFYFESELFKYSTRSSIQFIIVSVYS
ncbi:uncharacterized protein METZ01_LOCUS416199, partial [marine metagenome]